MGKKEAACSEADSVSVESIHMQRSIGFWAGTSFIVGSIVGSGIFISPKLVLESSGSVALSLICWFICGVISMMAALCFAELGTVVKKSGAEYSYLLAAFGSVPAFLCSWVNTLLIMTSSIAVINLTCAEYVIAPFYSDECGPPPTIIIKLTAIVVTLFLTWVNCVNVTLASRIQVVFTACKVLALVIIVIGGIVKLAQGHVEHIGTGFEGSEQNPSKVAMAMYSGMWAYSGWNGLNYITEEVINPEKNLPRCIMLGLSMVTGLYLLVNMSYMVVLSVPELLASPAVAVTWADRVIASASWTMPLFVAMSTFGAANGNLFAAGRLTFVTAREGHMMQMFAMVNVHKYTPPPSLIFTAVISVVMIVLGNILSLIDFFGFTTWLFLGMSVAALIRLRYTMPDHPRPYKVPLVIPICMLLVCVFMLVAPLVQDPQVEFLYAVMFILAGLLFYLPFIHYQIKVPGLETLTTWVQLLMEVVPEKWTD